MQECGWNPRAGPTCSTPAAPPSTPEPWSCRWSSSPAPATHGSCPPWTGSRQELVTDSLVHRYHNDGSDGFAEPEGTFNLCSFWYVEALTRAGRLDQARHTFEKMLTYANHLGLYAEEIGPSGEALGNFPQAFTHLALISAAVNLDRALAP